MKQIALMIAIGVAGCGFYKETNIETDEGTFGCWVHIHTNALPSLKRVKAAHERYNGKSFRTCKSVSGIRFYVEGSGQGSYLIVRNSGEVLFIGTSVPRSRWDEAEGWSETYCDEKGVTCGNRVTADGKVISGPTWSRDTPVFITQ